MVCKHLSKLYDSLANLRWKVEGNPKLTKHANIMIAKDGEEMSMHETCDCSGKVLYISVSICIFQEKVKRLQIRSERLICHKRSRLVTVSYLEL